MTVTFCGHSQCSDADHKIQKQLYKEIENLILQGATEFLLGGYGEFDTLCAQTVKRLKFQYPNITSVLVIPYMDRDYNKEIYDCSEYPPIETVPKRFAILKRNEYMVDRADVVIAYVQYGWGGSAQTLAYAKRKQKQIIRIDAADYPI